MKPNGKMYHLQTIADIWALPDADVMERALRALALRLTQIRRYAENRPAHAAAPARGEAIVFDWVDSESGCAALDDDDDLTLGIFNNSIEEKDNGERAA